MQYVGETMAKKLVKHGNSLALIIDKRTLKALGVEDDTSFDLEIKNKTLVVKPVIRKKASKKEKDIDIAKRIVRDYEPVFKKLAKT